MPPLLAGESDDFVIEMSQILHCALGLFVIELVCVFVPDAHPHLPHEEGPAVSTNEAHPVISYSCASIPKMGC